MDNLKAIIESLLFASDVPLSADKMRSILEMDDSQAIVNVLTSLVQEYDSQKRGFFLSEVAGGYQLRTRPENREWVRRMRQTRPARLSRAALETLAIVAYKQPVLRSSIESVRGVNVDGVLRTLMERDLVRIIGRGEGPGRPLLFGTTREFLMQFGLSKLSDLPGIEEIEELIGQQAEAVAELIPEADAEHTETQ